MILYVQVVRNRVQSLRGCAISVRERVRGVIQENLVYQGYPDNNKPHIYTDPLNQECVMLSNTLLTHRYKSYKYALFGCSMSLFLHLIVHSVTSQTKHKLGSGKPTSSSCGQQSAKLCSFFASCPPRH